MTCHDASNREYVSKQHTTSSFVFIHIYTSARHCGLFQAWENYCAHAFRESVETKFFGGKFKTFCWMTWPPPSEWYEETGVSLSFLFLHLFASLGYICYPLFKLAIQKIGNKVFPIQNQRFQLTAVQLFSPNVNEMTQARIYCSTTFSLLFWRDLPYQEKYPSSFFVSTTPPTDCLSQHPFLEPKKDHFNPFCQIFLERKNHPSRRLF